MAQYRNLPGLVVACCGDEWITGQILWMVVAVRHSSQSAELGSERRGCESVCFYVKEEHKISISKKSRFDKLITC